jgi:hypothetical protein
MNIVESLINVAEDNNASEQMDYDQYECLIALIEDGTIKSVEQLSNYMDIE